MNMGFGMILLGLCLFGGVIWMVCDHLIGWPVVKDILKFWR